jgi:ribosome-associated protein
VEYGFIVYFCNEIDSLMPRKKKTDDAPSLTDVIVESILNKKGKDPVIMDFTKMNNGICDAFIICHGTSRTQVEALAENVIQEVKKKTGQNPYHKEGFENAEWILIDFNEIIVHIFQDDRRSFYNLEQLWADTKITRVKSSD